MQELKAASTLRADPGIDAVPCRGQTELARFHLFT
jgi:hypothetical protein